MDRNAELKFGLIGCGGIMGWHIGNLMKVPNVRVVAMADPVADSIKHHKNAHAALAGAATFSCHHELLEKARPDAVIIASRHSDHYGQIADALNAGAHVLVEKPFVPTVAEARKVIALAKRKKKVLMISYQRHFDPKYRYMRELVRSGRIGNIQTISSALGQWWMVGTRGSWRQDPKYSRGGQLNDSGSHIVDIPLWITGLKPVEVFASLENRGCRVDINSSVTVRLSTGALWSISIGGNTPGFWEYLIISGDKGTLAFENGNLNITEGRIRTKGEGFGGYHDQTAGFVKAIRKQTPNEVPGEFGLLVTALTQAAFKSAKAKKPVKVQL
jgi:predicted dehydrogenase